MMFSSAVMCGNRLKRWNTMPVLQPLPRDLALAERMQLVVLRAR